MEPFVPGDVVTLTDTEHSVGRVVDVLDDGRIEVRWTQRPGHDHDVTLEPAALLRRVHESEAGLA